MSVQRNKQTNKLSFVHCSSSRTNTLHKHNPPPPCRFADGIKPTHSVLWSCAVLLQTSAVPLEGGDTFTITIHANPASTLVLKALPLAMLVAAFAWATLNLRGNPLLW